MTCSAIGDDDLRALPFVERRDRLDRFIDARPDAVSTSRRSSPFSAWEELDDTARHAAAPDHRRRDAQAPRFALSSRAGRKGPWFKWKRDPHIVDAVLMYAQRGHGKRSSYYSDYTFGVWAGTGGRGRTGAGRQGLFRLHRRGAEADRQICARQHHRAFRPGALGARRQDFGLVLEVAFEGLNRSTRHKSGVAMRFPRISRLRWDKPSDEADRIETLQAMLDCYAGGLYGSTDTRIS